MKIAGSGFETPTAPDTTSASTYGSNPHNLILACCSSSRLLETMPIRTRGERREHCEGALDGTPGGQIGFAIGRRRRALSIGVAVFPRLREQPAEPFLPGVVESSRSGEDLQVQLLEDARVGLFECIERQSCEGPCDRCTPHQRRPRGMLMIEERIVEIEQDGAGDASGLHSFIIETACLGCMVN